MIKKASFLILLLFAIFSFSSLAQQTAVFDNPHADYTLALELFNKQKFGAAQQLFLKTIERVQDPDADMRINSEYYAAICAYELFHPDAEKMLSEFIYNHPTHHRQNVAVFHMGNLQFRNRKYEEALTWYKTIDLFDLSQEQRNEFNFKVGYSHFMNDDFSKAKPYFFQIRDPKSLYFGPATYYYAHIAYTQGNYETAMKNFQKIRDNETFKEIIPFYIAQIYFLQGKYDELIAYATPLLKNNQNTRRAAEISRLIGEAHYFQQDYALALPFLKTYIDQNRQRISREEHYKIAFTFYKTGDFTRAIHHFERVTNAQDTLAQNALYHLADSYLKTGNKHSARNAFQLAHRMEFIPHITQNSLFNYAKLSFELSLDPFNEAILSFQRYIALYPTSPRRDEALQHLVNLFLTSNNYRDALASIEAITVKTPVLRTAHQRVAYFRGVELFNNGDFKSAIEHFDISLRFPENRIIRAQSLFWKGEALFRLGQYQESIDQLNRFLVTPGAFSIPEFNLANYTIGYAFFKQNNHRQAITAFRKFVAEPRIDRNHRNDAYLRIGDSYFVTMDYPAAITFYDRAIALRGRDIDYAIFQKALAEGATGHFQRKIGTLNSLLQQYPGSLYADDARYELANSHMIVENNADALRLFNEIVTLHPNSGFVKSAMLKTGLIHYNLKQDERALESFRNVVRLYPGTIESREALQAMRNIYIALDRVDEFVRFSQGLNIGSITSAQQDSLTYMAAENRFMQGDCNNAVQSFNNYIERFPNGVFAVNAHFYMAECNFRLNEFQRALRGYEFVLGRPISKFSENAALRAAQINFRMQQYDAALGHYRTLERIAEHRNNILEAQLGQMRSLDKLERSGEAMEVGRKIISNERVSQEILQEANLIIARAAMITNDFTLAREHFRTVNRIAQNEMAAEAKYNLALIEFRLGNYKECETMIFNFINQLSAYDYWLAKLFLLLADNYLIQNNVFQARHTLQSIIENYEGEEIRNIARAKLNEIDRMGTQQ